MVRRGNPGLGDRQSWRGACSERLLCKSSQLSGTQSGSLRPYRGQHWLLGSTCLHNGGPQESLAGTPGVEHNGRDCAGCCWAMQPFCCGSSALHSHLEGSNFMEMEGGAGCPGNQLWCLNSSANHPRHLGGEVLLFKAPAWKIFISQLMASTPSLFLVLLSLSFST